MPLIRPITLNLFPSIVTFSLATISLSVLTRKVCFGTGLSSFKLLSFRTSAISLYIALISGTFINSRILTFGFNELVTPNSISLPTLAKVVGELEKDKKLFEDNSEKDEKTGEWKYIVTINGEDFTERKKAGEKLLEIRKQFIKEYVEKNPDTLKLKKKDAYLLKEGSQVIGKISGFDVVIRMRGAEGEKNLILNPEIGVVSPVSNTKYGYSSSQDAVSLAGHLQREIRGTQADIDRQQNRSKVYEKDIKDKENYLASLPDAFPKQKELEDAVANQMRLTALLDEMAKQKSVPSAEELEALGEREDFPNEFELENLYAIRQDGQVFRISTDQDLSNALDLKTFGSFSNMVGLAKQDGFRFFTYKEEGRPDAETDEGAEFSVTGPTSEEIQEMQEVVKEQIDLGNNRLSDIQDLVAEELGDDSAEMRNLVADAYNEYGRGEDTPEDVVRGVIGRIEQNLSAINGNGVEILENTSELMAKANELGNIEYHNSIKNFVAAAITTLALSTSNPNYTAETKNTITHLVDKFYTTSNGKTYQKTPSEVIQRALKLWERFGKPDIELGSENLAERKRARATNLPRVTLRDISSYDDFIAELAHAAQFESKAKLDIRKYLTQKEYDSIEYDRKGSVEYDAHKFIERMIGIYIMEGTPVLEEYFRDSEMQEFKDIINKYGLNDVFYQYSPEGKILGFTHNGKIYLNGKHLNPNTPIHEAGHIWTNWAEQNKPEIYNRGIELVSGSAYLDKVKANPFYQQQASKLAESEREKFYQHEAIAMVIGDKGAQFVTEAKKEGVAAWLKNLWNAIKNALGFDNITPQELQNLTFEQFANRAVVDILREREQQQELDEEEQEQQDWEDHDPIADIAMTTSGEVGQMLSGKTITETLGYAPEGSQDYERQKLVDMLQDGKNMIGAAMGKWGTDLADYGQPLFNYIKNMSTDDALMGKKAVLMATFLGEIREEINRNPNRADELRPLDAAVTAFYQNYMNQRGKEVAAGRLLRLYRDKYMGDIFANQILEEQEMRDLNALRKLQADQMDIEARIQAGIEEFKRVTQAEKDADGTDFCFAISSSNAVKRI